jgi:hypothetical protein
MSILCPSSRCEEGATLLGIVLPGGRVAFAKDRIVVDEGFVQNATREGSHAPETRFRFSNPCARGACHQWTGSRCGVIDSVLGEAHQAGHAPPSGAPLPECSIRGECRWFEQSGAAACAVCDLVVTDTRSQPSGKLESEASGAEAIAR